MAAIQRITPCLWFDDQAEEAVGFYTSIFPRSRVVTISRYGQEGREIHGKPPGSVLTVAFELDGQAFTALNGGPMFKFNEAVSLQIADPEAQQCGWLKDRFGLSWQIVPRVLIEMMSGPVSDKSERVMKAIFQMKKLDIGTLERAYAGR
jgi:predicted 3-demethylubiquinone-9 3-methyltransferase (glyoxalase superfamily)